MVIYDNEKGKIGWIRAPCDRAPKFGSSSSSALLWSFHTHPLYSVYIHPQPHLIPISISPNSDNTVHGFEEGYCWPQFLPGIIGLPNEDCPAYYRSNKEWFAEAQGGEAARMSQEGWSRRLDTVLGSCVFFRKGEKLAHVNIIMFISNIMMITLLRVQSFRTFSLYILYLVFFLLMWYILRFQVSRDYGPVQNL